MAALENLLKHFARDGNNVRITGANLHIRNGRGTTETTNALGNLIVGYNELRGEGVIPPNVRTGSHNVVVGQEHNFSRFGGLVVGRRNEISGDYAVVSGGQENTASGTTSSISGGRNNTASSIQAVVSAGVFNTASGHWASVSGGFQNIASGFQSSVSGGNSRTAPRDNDWVARLPLRRLLGAWKPWRPCARVVLLGESAQFPIGVKDVGSSALLVKAARTLV